MSIKKKTFFYFRICKYFIQVNYNYDKKNFISYVISLIFIITFFLKISSYFFNKISQKQKNDLKIKYQVVENKRYINQFQCNTFLNSDRIIEIKSEINNTKIAKILTSDNSFVKKNQILAILENYDGNSKFSSAQLNYAVKMNEYHAAQESFEKNLISKNEFDIIKANFNSFKSEFEKAKKYSNSYFITAPFDGYISEIFLKEGSVVSYGIPILEIVDNLNIKLFCNIGKSMKNKISINNKAFIKYKNDTFNSKVLKIAPLQNKDTGLHKIEFDVSEIINNLSLFESLLILVNKDEIEAFKTDLNAIFAENNKYFAKILNPENVLISKEVKIIDEDLNYIYVNGLINGDKIILENQQNLEVNKVYSIDD